MIKFRAWEDRWKEYIKDVLIGSNGEIYFDDGVATQDNLDISIEQFTGLKDVSGKEIYENDIIKYTSEDGEFFYAKVKYFADDDNYPAFDFIPPDEDWHFQSNCLSEGTFSNALEVVGNVHTNPELLEVEK